MAFLLSAGTALVLPTAAPTLTPTVTAAVAMPRVAAADVRIQQGFGSMQIGGPDGSAPPETPWGSEGPGAAGHQRGRDVRIQNDFVLGARGYRGESSACNAALLMSHILIASVALLP